MKRTDFFEDKEHWSDCYCQMCDKVDETKSFNFYEENKPSPNNLEDCSLINLTDDLFNPHGWKTGK